MTKPIIKTIEVKAGVNPDYLENALTTDITVLESIFDLIDNSIDAARDHLITQNDERDIYGLPNDYTGYKIKIRLGKGSIAVLDNCLGMDESTLSSHAFKTANASSHRFGIGHYGLGLKRALLKFGGQYAMSSDNGVIAFKMRFDNSMIAGDKKLMADAYNSSGHRKTLFVVSNIKPEISFEIQGKSWFENALKLLNIRYAAYTAKGLKISISNAYLKKCLRINGNLPTIRTNSKFNSIQKHIEINGVSVFIDAGIHKDYVFTIEDAYIKGMNDHLTNEFGLYFICNDRVIVASSTAEEHGWKTKWHSEYNGFVCMVRFISEDSQRMPWNTVKTALRTDGQLFVTVRDELQPIAELYRQTVKKIYPPANTKKPNPSNSNGAALNNALTFNVANVPAASNTGSNAPKPKPTATAGNNQQMHPTNWDTLLPAEFPVSSDDVLNAFIIESTKLKCDILPCACALLLRSTLERALRQFVYKSGKFDVVKSHFYESSEGKKKNHSDEYKRAQGLELTMMLNWLSDGVVAESIFETQRKQELWLASKKAKAHTQKLNGVVHGNELIDSGQLRMIRNEIYPLLKFCVEKP